VSTATLDPVLDRLVLFSDISAPVVSLYLDLRPDQHGREHHTPFIERAFEEQMATFPPSSEARASLGRDLARIKRYLATPAERSRRAVALFSSSGEPDLFEAVSLDVPLDGHRLYVDRQPHLFPLARLADQYATYAALLLNTNAARLYVFAAGGVQRQTTVTNEKLTRVAVGGWSQARYQRHVDHLHLRHVKEVAEAIERVVRDEGVDRVIVAGDEIAVPLLREQLPRDVDARIVDVLRLDIRTPEHEVLRATLEAFRRKDADDDRTLVSQLLDAYRSGGLATIGVTGVRAALDLGQADRLLAPAHPSPASASEASDAVRAGVPKELEAELDETTVEDLVSLARRTDARVTFIEDSRLLAPARGVGALLRFRR
jgi:peptide chain release factor subunit 1